MRCLNPLTIEGNYNAKERKTVYSAKRSKQACEIDGYMVSCGQCIACRINRARMWSLRNAHESMFHDDCCFITLTYNPENLPTNLSVSNEVHQKFLKRLRHNIYRESKTKIRYYMAAEYGQPSDEEKNLGLSNVGRPHYHYLIYGWKPDDLTLINSGKKGNPYYSSEKVLKAWQNKGFVVIGNVTPDSAAYVAGYCTKKITGTDAEDHYSRVHPDTGERFQVEPEFQRCSQGIGGKWVEKYFQDMQKGFITFNGKIYGIPRYYMQKLNKICDLATGDARLKYIDTLDQMHLNRIDPQDFEVLPDFEDLQYKYDVAKLYEKRSKERQFINQQF